MKKKRKKTRTKRVNQLIITRFKYRGIRITLETNKPFCWGLKKGSDLRRAVWKMKLIKIYDEIIEEVWAYLYFFEMEGWVEYYE